MKNFIEVTEINERNKVLCPIGKITAVVDMGTDGAFIETGFDRKGESTGICTAESYSEIKEKLFHCEV